MKEHFRVYFDPAEIGDDGYPKAWHRISDPGVVKSGDPSGMRLGIKDIVRMEAGHRCVRCGHPYEKGGGEWSACDDRCRHPGPMRVWTTEGWTPFDPTPEACGAAVYALGTTAEAQWRILTVHHLNGVKYDCRWWNLVSLCQRCHLTIQGKVYLERPWRREHSEWFKIYVAAYYASSLLGEELTREETAARLDELLDLQFAEPSLF